MSSPKKYGINYGMVNERIYAGRLNKVNTEFLADKEDVTLTAVEAVGAYLIAVSGGGGTLDLGNKILHISAEYEEKKK